MNKKTVALALSSGGARGYAHIGVIKVLEEFGYEIKTIAGSSIGAVIGGIYAAGKLDIYTEWVKSLHKIDVLRLLDLSFNKKAIFKGDKVINFVEKLIGDCNIEEFSIKFTAVAVDILKRKEFWFNQGSLWTAIRASTAIPGVFTPVYLDNKILVDGGVLNPLPIAPVLNSNVDLIIAVDVNSEIEYKNEDFEYIFSKEQEIEELNIVDILMQSVIIMQSKITQFKLAAYTPDILIEIPRNSCGLFDFHLANEMIQLGKNIAKKVFLSNQPPLYKH